MQQDLGGAVDAALGAGLAAAGGVPGGLGVGVAEAAEQRGDTGLVLVLHPAHDLGDPGTHTGRGEQQRGEELLPEGVPVGGVLDAAGVDLAGVAEPGGGGAGAGVGGGTGQRVPPAGRWQPGAGDGAAGGEQVDGAAVGAGGDREVQDVGLDAGDQGRAVPAQQLGDHVGGGLAAAGGCHDQDAAARLGGHGVPAQAAEGEPARGGGVDEQAGDLPGGGPAGGAVPLQVRAGPAAAAAAGGAGGVELPAQDQHQDEQHGSDDHHHADHRRDALEQPGRGRATYAGHRRCCGAECGGRQGTRGHTVIRSSVWVNPKLRAI